MSERTRVSAILSQTTQPKWGPLERVVGEHLAEHFMWMFELRSGTGIMIQVYKHRATRVHLYLGHSGEAYACVKHPGRSQYVVIDHATAIASVFARWSVLEASPEDVFALRAALRAVRRSA